MPEENNSNTMPPQSSDVPTFDREITPEVPSLEETPAEQASAWNTSKPATESNNDAPVHSQGKTSIPVHQFNSEASTTIAPAATPMASTTVEPSTAQPFPQPNPAMQNATPQKQGKNKKLLVGILAGVGALLLLGSSVAAYMVYQSPQKVLGDAIGSLFSAKTYVLDGSAKYSPKAPEGASAQDPIVVTYNLKGTRYSGTLDANVKTKLQAKDIDVSGSLVYSDKADIYFKLSGLKSFIDSYGAAMGEAAPSAVQDLVKKVDGKWYVFTNQDMKDLSPESAKVQQCVTDVMREVDKDSSLLKEVGQAYAKNQFIKVAKELGMKDGSIGYQIDSDKTKAKDFGNALKESKLYKKLAACDKNSADSIFDTESSTSGSTSSTTTVEVWVDQWSHQPTKFVVEDHTKDASFVSETKMKLNGNVVVTTPSGVSSYKELQKDIESLTSSFETSAIQTGSGSAGSETTKVTLDIEMFAANNSGRYPTYAELSAFSTDTESVLTSKMPTADPGFAGKVQYENCSIHGGVVRYYDTVKKSVQSIDVGEGCKSV